MMKLNDGQQGQWGSEIQQETKATRCIKHDQLNTHQLTVITANLRWFHHVLDVVDAVALSLYN